MANSIPFLRDHRNTDNLQFVKGKFEQLDIYGPISPTVGNHSINLLKGGKARKLLASKKRETGWNNHIIPISKYNEGVHSSMKIPFE